MSKADKALKIKQLMEYYGFNQREFANYTGIPEVNVSKILRGERPCGGSVTNKILLAFDKINAKWFEGDSDEMFKPNRIPNACSHKHSLPAVIEVTESVIEVECPNCGEIIEVKSDVILPAVPPSVARMPNIDLEQFMKNHPQEMEEIDLRRIWGKGVFVVIVDTRAMEPEYREGTRLVLRKLPSLTYAAPDGRAYVIDTMLPHTLFRYFSKERDGSYKLSASRESGRDPMWLQENDIQHVYDIVGFFKVGR